MVLLNADSCKFAKPTKNENKGAALRAKSLLVIDLRGLSKAKCYDLESLNFNIEIKPTAVPRNITEILFE